MIKAQNIFTPEELVKYKELTDAILGNDGSELNDGQKREKIKEMTKLKSEALMKKEAQLTDNKKANIGLMNITDYCSSFESDKELNCMSSMVAQMLNFGYDDVNETADASLLGLTWLTTPIDLMAEWTLSNAEFGSGLCVAWCVGAYGDACRSLVHYENPARPVFFLTSDIELSGEGTIESPFRIAGIE